MQWLAKRLASRLNVSEKDILPALAKARTSGTSWDAELLESVAVDEAKLLLFFKEEMEIPMVEDLDQRIPSTAFLDHVPAYFARQHLVLGLEGDGAIQVATCFPMACGPLDDISFLTGMPVETCLADRETLERCINRAYQRSGGDAAEILDEITSIDLGDLARDVEISGNLLDMAQAPPIVKLVNSIMFQGLRMRASDVHIQPYEQEVMVRLRIDGVLYDIMAVPKKIQDAVISRIKVMGNMDIAERRLPQDGRAFMQYGNHDVDLRISSVPTAFGERIVIRLLDKSARQYNLEELGMNNVQMKYFDQLIHSPHGIVFVTGPTGSGKTTTLYAALQRINATEKNIMTIEDPIEYQMSGISQMEVNTKKGLTFDTGLRHILRQDPDIMMVGEVRDHDTASIATQCAQTGHLVFSTLHTNDASGAMTRLLDIGVEPYLVASTIIAVQAQRLIRRICTHCKEYYVPDDVQLTAMGISRDVLVKGVLWRGRGCQECMHTGYLERTGIYELLIIDDEIRKLVMQREGAAVIKQKAVKHGMHTLRMDGIEKAINGITTFDEVAQITQRDAL